MYLIYDEVHCSRLGSIKWSWIFFVLLVNDMVYAPWVNEWFDHVDLDELGGFFRLSSYTWELQGSNSDVSDQDPESDHDNVSEDSFLQIIWYNAEDDAENIDENDHELVEQEDFEYQLWVRGIAAYAELFDPSDEWEVWWNENFAPRREPWLYVKIDGYVGRHTPWWSDEPMWWSD